MSRNSELRIQTLILILLLPTLFAMTVLTGWLIYGSLYDDILSGFDRKLRAVSTVTGSFIDPDEHDGIFARKSLTALAFDPATRSLHGCDEKGTLYRIEVATGEALAVASTGLTAVTDLAFEPSSGRLYAIDSRKRLLVKIDPASGAANVVGPIGHLCFGLAFEPFSGTLYGSGESLLVIDRETGRGRPLFKLTSGLLTDLDFGPHEGFLYGLDSDNERLVRIDLESGRTDTIGLLKRAPPQAGENPEETGDKGLRSYGLAYSPSDRSFFAISDRLGRIDPVTAEVVAFGYPGFRSERDPKYLNYVVPMRRIKERADLTYLYTFLLENNDQDIVYVLDANTDEDHSYIGDVDADGPAEGTVRVFHEGGVHLSDIQSWEQWGLIKSADAAIYDIAGEVRGIAGADINISIIEQKTKQALLTVCLVGLACIGLASVAAVRVSNKLVRPVGKLKDQALRIAAGRFGQRVQVQSPAELKDLAGSFNGLSQVLKATLEDLNQSNRELEAERRTKDLVLALARHADRNFCPQPCPIIHGRVTQRPIYRDSSGWFYDGDRFLFWIVETSPRDPLEAVRLRSDLAVILERLIRNGSSKWSQLSSLLGGFLEDRVTAFLCLDPVTWRIDSMVRGPLSALLIDGNRLRLLNLAKRGNLKVKGSQAILFSTPAIFGHLTERKDELGPLLKQAGSAVEISETLGLSLKTENRELAKTDSLFVVMRREI